MPQQYLYVRTDLEIIKKPEWLDDFRKRYDESFPHHVSLKRAVAIADHEVKTIQEMVTKITKNFRPFKVRFSEVFTGKTKYGHTIMLRADESKELHALRDQVFESFKKYTTYYQPEHKAFDEDFNPHLTIARHLSEQQLAEALKMVKEPVEILADINALKFVVTQNPHDITFPPTLEATIPFLD